MGRKLIACSFLYVAPTSLDFSIPSHSTKKWQRRWFTLYSDGGLEVRIDSSADTDTVPQLKMDMKRCIRLVFEVIVDFICCVQKFGLMILSRALQKSDRTFPCATAFIEVIKNVKSDFCVEKNVFDFQRERFCVEKARSFCFTFFRCCGV
jgi:hypothetical protein